MFSNSLALSGSFYLKGRDELFEIFPTTFWAFRLPSIVLSDVEDGGKFLFAFWASVFVTRHTFSSLSLLKCIFQTAYHYVQQTDITIERGSSVNR